MKKKEGSVKRTKGMKKNGRRVTKKDDEIKVDGGNKRKKKKLRVKRKM